MKLSVEEVKRKLISCKYQYPATIYDREGNVIRVVTHNIKATLELREMHPSLKHEINRITEEKPKKPQTVRQMINHLGKSEGNYFMK